MRAHCSGVATTRRSHGLLATLLAGLGLLALAAALPAHAGTAIVQGNLNYEKVPATAQGLRLSSAQPRPVAGVTVWIIKLTAGGAKASITVLGRGVTDDTGYFQITIPISAPTMVYVLVRAESDNVQVLNANSGSLYAYRFPDFLLSSDQTATRNGILTDSTRASGPFNILALIRAANKLVRSMSPGAVLPPIIIVWATDYRGGTGFSAAAMAIFLNGDRNVDSDELDDSVVCHEYSHYLHFVFSRNDSPRGTHFIGTGEQVHPSLAFSEGWADFFGQVILNDPNSIDTFGTNGSRGNALNLEQNVPVWDRPSYASQFTVSSVLWDLFDAAADEGDTLALGIGPIWKAFTGGLRTATIVYLIALCDAFARDNADQSDVLAGLTANLSAHQISYTPGTTPSVTNPFPAPLDVNTTVSGSLDSTAPESRADRWNLLAARATYSFTLASSTSVDLLLTIVSSRNTGAADLDVYVWNARDELVGILDTPNGVGGTERVTANLPAGTYRVEVWSFWYDTAWHYDTAEFQLTRQ